MNESVQARKLDLAIQAYINNEADLRGGAAMAEVPYNRFYREVESRNIVIIDETYFLDELDFLAGAFGNKALQKAVKKSAQSAIH